MTSFICFLSLEGDADDNANIFASLTNQHFQGDIIHEMLPSMRLARGSDNDFFIGGNDIDSKIAYPVQ